MLILAVLVWTVYDRPWLALGLIGLAAVAAVLVDRRLIRNRR